MVINRGRGLAMLGGLRTLGSGRYSDTVFSDLLPVDVSAVGHWPGPVEFELTQEGLTHPVCQLEKDPSANESLWKRVGPFAGASRLGEVKPAAQVLMQSSAGQPLLVVQEAGKGRTAVAAFDSTWQWSFADEAGRDIQRRFWRQLVFWLVNQRAEVWVTTDQPRYDLARLRSEDKKVLIQAGVADTLTDKLSEDVEIAGEIVGPDDKTNKLDWIRKADGVEAQLAVQEAGTYKVTVESRKGNQEIGQSETAFMVESVDVELVEPFADIETLKQMATPTDGIGGRYLGLDDLSDLLQQIRAARYSTPVTHVHRYRLVDDYPWCFLVVFVLVVAVEWIMRKRSGLV
jgi:hypothetical protein